MRYSDKVERLTAKMGATFIDYEPGSGAWTFKVDTACTLSVYSHRRSSL